MAQVGHLNELHERYSDEGLVVVGVTNEDPELVESVVHRQGMEYPVVRVQGGSVDSAYGVRSFPSAFLVGRDGSVVWSGHPGALSGAVIEAALNP